VAAGGNFERKSIVSAISGRELANACRSNCGGLIKPVAMGPDEPEDACREFDL
jgi:hypothetical protein